MYVESQRAAGFIPAVRQRPGNGQAHHDGDEPRRSLVAVEARRLTHVRGRKTVLREVDFALLPGELVALQGANGAGKSTLLHCLAGALHPSGGEVLWFGENGNKLPGLRRQIGFLGHESGLYLNLTAWENLLFAGRMYGVDKVGERADRLFTIVGLQRHKHQPAKSLSRGMKQRVAIARAVIHEPPILLLDEPFTCLDSVSRDWLGRFLTELRGRGRAILIACHEVDQSLFDRVMILQGGRLRPMESEANPQRSQQPEYLWSV